MKAVEQGHGRLLIRGIDGEGRAPEELTQEQLASVRLIIAGPELQGRLDEAEEALLGEQYGHDVLMFDTFFGDEVAGFLRWALEEARAQESHAARLEHDLAVLFLLNRHDSWVADHECGWGAEPLLEELAEDFRRLLAKSSAELGIDDEFTRPGILCLLEEFAEKLHEPEYFDEPVKFKYLPPGRR